MNNIFNTNKPVAHTGRNGFDLSFSSAFSCRPGVSRPVYVQHTVPNSSYKISCGDIVRTSSLQQAAFLRGKQELDFYFVPYSMIYSRSNDVILQRGEDHSVSELTLSNDSFPKFPLVNLIWIASIPYVFMRFMQFLGKLTLSDIAGVFQVQPTPIDLRPLSNFTAGYCLYDPQELYANSPLSMFQMCVYNVVPQIFNKSSEPAEFIGVDCLAMLDSLGYGNFYPSISQAVNDVLDELDPGDYETREAQIDLASTLASRVEALLLKLDSSFDRETRSLGNKMVNLLPLFAYQKVWRDNYRDSINDDSLEYLYASNMDYDFGEIHFYPISEVDEGGADPNPLLDPLLTFLRPRRRMYLKDLSSGLYPSPQFGDPGNTAIDPSLQDKLNIPDEIGGNRQDTAVAIQFALAMQRYRQMLLRAGNRTKDLLMAEFGVRSQYIDEHYSRYLGSFDGALELNKVSATADTGTYSVGDLAANIFSGLSGKEIDFTCNDHGMIIGVLSFFPDSMHNSYGLDPFNIKFENLHFYHEAFENLGLGPVSSDIFSLFNLSANGDEVVSNPSTLGFSARYSEYKQRLDQVHDAFYTSPIIFDKDGKVKSSYDGIKSNYVVVKPVQQTLAMTKNRSYILPSCMDTIFTSVDRGDFDTYHFDVILQFNVTSVQPMSVLGLI